MLDFSVVHEIHNLYIAVLTANSNDTLQKEIKDIYNELIKSIVDYGTIHILTASPVIFGYRDEYQCIAVVHGDRVIRTIENELSVADSVKPSLEISIDNHIDRSIVKFYLDRLRGTAVEKCISELARWMMANITIGDKYRIAEAECYYFNQTDHPDPYVHKHKDQLATRTLYFHRKKAAKIGFTLKGIDITFGNGTDYGGMLIRSLIEIDTGTITEGPSKVVDLLLVDNNVSSVTELKTSGKSISLDVDTNDPLIMVGPRIGLNPVKSPEYRNRNYRFAIKGIKKDKSKLS